MTYTPTIPSPRDDLRGWWTTAFPDFEAAVTDWALLYAAFGYDAEEAVKLGLRWAMQHGYFPPGYSRKPIAHDRIVDIKARVRVEDVAAQLTELRGNGTTLTGKCPFHGEVRGRAFVVWTDIQRWRCYGACSTGGDVIDLIQRTGINPLMSP